MLWRMQAEQSARHACTHIEVDVVAGAGSAVCAACVHTLEVDVVAGAGGAVCAACVYTRRGRCCS
eukprot:315362-Chlamydomonas_euryale.AAC.1